MTFKMKKAYPSNLSWQGRVNVQLYRWRYIFVKLQARIQHKCLVAKKVILSVQRQMNRYWPEAGFHICQATLQAVFYWQRFGHNSKTSALNGSASRYFAVAPCSLEISSVWRCIIWNLTCEKWTAANKIGCCHGCAIGKRKKSVLNCQSICFLQPSTDLLLVWEARMLIGIDCLTCK